MQSNSAPTLPATVLRAPRIHRGRRAQLPGQEDNAVTPFLKKNIDSKVWFHDLLHPDGSPYDPVEIELFKKFHS